MRFSGMVVSVFVLLAGLLIGSIPAAAQQPSGSISGVVQDSAGALVPGARVELTNQLQGSSRVMSTSTEGTFVFTPLQPAIYTLSVEASGFKKSVQTDITLYANDRLSLPVTLEIGTLTETVTVEASAVQLQTQSAERGGVVTGTQMVEIALNGRGWTGLLKLVPGTPSDTTAFNGARTDQNNQTVDGITTMDAGSNGFNVVAINIDSIAEVKVLTNSQQAEFGKSAGASIQLVTKGGTREFHGTGYLFHRHENLNANNWRNNADKVRRPLGRYKTFGYNVGGPVYIPGKFNQNKDRLFFFIGHEWNRQLSISSLYSLTMPTEAERQGDFGLTHEADGRLVTIKDPTRGLPFSNNIIPRTRWHPDGQKILTFYPLPTVAGNPAYNYQSQIPGSDKRIQGVYRGDYNISDNWRLFGRIINNHDVIVIPYGSPYGNNCRNNLGYGAGFDTGYKNWGGALNLTTIINPTFTNELIWGFAQRDNYCFSMDDYEPYKLAKSGISFQQLYPNADKLKLVPNFNFGGVPGAPSTEFSGLPYTNYPANWDLADHVAKVFPTHTLKAGVFVLSNLKNQVTTAWVAPRIYFDRDSLNPGDTNWAYSNALLGNFRSYNQDEKFPEGHYQFHNVEWYIQDNWKVKRNLTLDYGMRFYWVPPWYEKIQQASTFNAELYNPSLAVVLYQPALNASGQNVARNPRTGELLPFVFMGGIVPGEGNAYNGIAVGGVNGYPKGMMEDRGIHYAPRFGLAWSPGQNRRTVIRFGAGVFYDRIQGNPIFNSVGNPPNFRNAQLYYGNLSSLSPGQTTLFPAVLRGGMTKDGKIGTTYNWNLGVQRELPGMVQLDVAYVGSISRHLPLTFLVNEAPYGSAWLPQYQDPTKTPKFDGSTTLPVNFLRPYAGYAGVTMTTSGGSSNFNSMQISLTRRMRGGLELGMNYMWSKALGTNAATTSSANNIVDTHKADYGPLDIDRTQNLVVNYIYTLPRLTRGSLLDHPVGRVILDNWQVSGIASFTSGAPITPSYSVSGVSTELRNRQITGSESWAPRVVFTGNPNLAPGDRALERWINTSVFQPAAKGSLSMDSGRGVIRGPGINNWDISIFKNVPYAGGEQRHIQLRVELFNAFNHTQFSGINSTATFDATGKITNLPTSQGGGGGLYGFGTVTSARTERRIQIAAKIYF